MRANNIQLNLSDGRHKEFHKQQERLKTMADSSDKMTTVSADLMIENLLRNSFTKPVQTSSNTQDHLYPELPQWLQCESTVVPAQYKYLWSLVQAAVDLADTQKVSQLLLTSGLHIDVLGFIWNLANKKIPGQLTKQEFYIVLALVGLAQTGYTFNNLSVVKILPAPSIPMLQVGVLQNQLPQSSVSSVTENSSFDSFQQPQNFPNQHSNSLTDLLKIEKPKSPVGETNEFSNVTLDFAKNKIEKKLVSTSDIVKINELETIKNDKEVQKNANFPCIGLSPTSTKPDFEDEFSEFQSVPAEEAHKSEKNINSLPNAADDFTEFQSANSQNIDAFETVVIMQKREIPKIPLPKNLTGKLSSLKPNILKISPERRMKVLSQPESLSTLPESKISSSNKVSTSISVLGSHHGIGSRLANHSLFLKVDKSKCHKHHKIKLNPSSLVQPNEDREVIPGVKSLNVEKLMPKCNPKIEKNCKTFVLKETKIRSEEIPNCGVDEKPEKVIDPPMAHSAENTRQIEIPMLGTFNETTLPTQAKVQTSNINLISVQEDKYSALREIELEVNQNQVHQSPKVEDKSDDFGEFLSANAFSPLPTISASNFIDIQMPEVTALPEVGNNEKGDWGEWNFEIETNPPSINNSILNKNENIEERKPQTQTIKAESDYYDSFALLSLDENDKAVKPLPDSQTAAQQDYFSQIESNSIMDNGAPLTFDTSNNFSAFECESNIETFNDHSLQLKSDQGINNNSNSELWEFSAPEPKLPMAENLSRQGSLPSLDLKMSAADEPAQDVVWRKCLESCYNLIHEGFEIFSNINVKSVLDEVFATPKTCDYLNYLNIIYCIAKRISQNNNYIFSNQEELELMWKHLEELCFEYNIKLKQDEDSITERKSTKIQCGICCGNVGQDYISHSSSCYHPSCANLWVNFIEESLPCLT